MALADIVGRIGRVRIVEHDRDRYGRIVAQTYVDDRDVVGELVRQGWALEYTRYSDGRYTALQNEAKAARRGM